jgi:hypothetical protein
VAAVQSFKRMRRYSCGGKGVPRQEKFHRKRLEGEEKAWFALQGDA